MKPYASYKPSGVPWLGDVPAHWEVNTIKRGYEITLGKMLQTEQKASTDVSAPYLRSANVQAEKVDVSDVQTMWFTEHEVQQLALEPNDLVVCEGGDAGRSAIWHGEIDGCYFQNSVNRVRGVGHNTTFYLMRWLGVVKSCGYMDIVCNKATIAHLTKEKLANLPMLFPPPDEQQAITDYLDTETARIDTLVQEKEELIGLLREAKLSTVSSILLGGLVGEIKKPSNTKWLGDVPASWVVCRVKHAVMRIEQGWSPECENRLCAPGEWGVLKAGACNHGRFNQAEHKFLPATLNPIPEYEVFAGDVLMSRASGSADLVGSVAFVDEVQPHLMLSDKLFRLVPEEHVDGRYLAWALNTDAQRRQILNCVRGAEGLARNITTTDIKQLWIALPTLDEQKQLAVEANKVASGFDALITHTQEEITLLKELRAATIADAVLGRVDVRSLTQKQ